MNRWSRWISRAAYYTLPEWFRDADGADLLLTHDARAGEITSSFALARFTMREAASFARLAVRLHVSPPSSRFAHANDNRLPPMETLRQDVAFALRNFSRRKAFTSLVLGTFGLGVAATTAMYSVVDAVLVRPIHAPQPDRIASIYPTFPSWLSNERLAAWWDRGTFTWPGYLEYKRTQRSFAIVAGYTWGTSTLVTDGAPERIGVGNATPEVFSILGARPVVGRLLAPDDPATVTVLSYDFWQSRYGGDPGVVGKHVTLGSRAYAIVGVLAPGFEMTRYWHEADVIDAALWRPIVSDGSDNYGPRNGFLSTFGRLRPGVTMEQASAEAARLIPQAMVGQDVKIGGRVVERIADQTSTFREPLLILIGASIVLLFAACASVAAMLVGAGMDREPELAVGAALGAGRGRLVRQLVTEGVLLGIAGGTFGIALATLLLKVLILIAPSRMPGLANASIDARILGVALAVSIGFALLFTIAPALVLSRVRLAGTAAAARVVRGGRGRLQQTLIVAELALATLLLLGAGLLTRTMHRLATVDPGFSPEGLIAVRVSPSSGKFTDSNNPSGVNARIAAYYAGLSDALRRIPGVQDVATAAVMPFSGDAGSNEVAPEGFTPRTGEVLDAERRPVSPNYFDVMKMHIVAGRGFTPDDNREDARRVVVVNVEMVRRYWPGTSGVGKRLDFWKRDWTVVGVVRDTRESNLRGDRSTKFYVPANLLGSPGGSLLLRITGDAATIMRAVRPTLASFDPRLLVGDIAMMRTRMGETVAEQRYRMRLMLSFSVLALVFAIAGVYGVLNRSVARRRRELGIRAALGAMGRDVVMMLLRHSLVLGAIGVSIGLVAGYFGTSVLESTLYDTQRNDPLTVLVIGAVVLGLSLVAAWQPANRAAKVDPMEVLRE
jgi:predicted permease